MNARSALAWFTLVALLAVAAPLHACLPLWADAELFDVCARIVLRGGQLHREVFYPIPPGMALAQSAVRGALGWRPEALRLADLAIVGCAVALLTRFILPPGRPGGRVWAACLLLFFYLGTTEYCHGQPDVWMFLPATAALALRVRRTETPAQTDVRGLAASAIEGVCWGLAFIVKPLVAMPALGVWLLSAALTRSLRRSAVDLLGLLLGGLLVGAALVGWEVATGNWTYFIRDAFGGWQTEYYQHSRGWTERALQALRVPWPWSLVHVAAVPLSVFWIVRALRTAGRPAAALAILSICYLLWFYQANFVQQQIGYHQVPPVFLALTLLIGHAGVSRRPGTWSLALAALALWAAVEHPVLRPSRLAWWGRCWTEGATPAVRDALSLGPRSPSLATYTDLARVADFLRGQDVHDGELTCFTAATVPLYQQLGILPSTRFIQPSTFIAVLPRARADVIRQINDSPQRFAVWDVRTLGVPAEEERGPVTVPAGLVEEIGFFREPVVFRAGRYVVHRIRPPEERRASEHLKGPLVIP